MSVVRLKRELRALASSERAAGLAWYFKTKPGEYGEGDKFIGVTMPQLRQLIKSYRDLSFDEIEVLLKSKIHEERMAALLILVAQYQRGDDYRAQEIYNFYLSHTSYINNWDLVDVSAAKIVGAYLAERNKDVLIVLARSSSMWERRVAIIATFYFIKAGSPEWTLHLAELMLQDEEDLIQKAVGWMLREVGKNCGEDVLMDFLGEEERYKTMPRTMLRYAVEKLPPGRRAAYLKGAV